MKNLIWSIFDKHRGSFSVDEMRKVLMMMLYMQKIYLENNDELNHKIDSPSKLSDYHDIYEIISKSKLVSEEYIELFKQSILPLVEKSRSFSSEFNSIIRDISSLKIKDIIKFSREIIYYEEYNDNSTVKELNELVYLILSEVKGDSYVDLCSGVGSFLGHVGLKESSLNLYGQEINYDAVLISRLYLSINNLNFKIEQGDVLKENKLALGGKKYSRLFANFPWLLKLRKHDIDILDNNYWHNYKYNFSMRNTSDWIFSSSLVNMLEKEGKAVALVVNGALYKITDIDIREKYISKGLIESVIQLPENILSFTNIASSLIVFSHHNDEVKFIDASGLYEKERRKNIIDAKNIFDAYKGNKSDLIANVSNEEIMNNESILLVSNYIKLDKINLINPTPLQEVVKDIFRGYQITAKQLDKYIVNKKHKPYNYEMLRLSDIQDGIISPNLIKVNMDDSKLDKYLLKDGDVVISAKSTKVKSAVVNLEENQNVVATGSILVIRPNKKLNSAYLKVFLDSREGKILLDSIQTGSVIVSINPSQLLKMEISLLSKKTQDRLGNKYLAKLDLIKITKNKLKFLEEEIEHIYDSESLGDES